jgi:hypothetical protein
MKDKLQNISFWNYPYEDLKIKIPRRQLFTLIIKELHIFSNDEESIGSIKLSSLGSMGDKKLENLIPFINNEDKLFVQNEVILFYNKSLEEPLELCYADDLSQFVIKLINGNNSIKDISRSLSMHAGISLIQSYNYTRGLFLTLVSFGVCVPLNIQV